MEPPQQGTPDHHGDPISGRSTHRQNCAGAGKQTACRSFWGLPLLIQTRIRAEMTSNGKRCAARQRTAKGRCPVGTKEKAQRTANPNRQMESVDHGVQKLTGQDVCHEARQSRASRLNSPQPEAKFYLSVNLLKLWQTSETNHLFVAVIVSKIRKRPHSRLF